MIAEALGLTPDVYVRELEPADEVVAELQAVVVAMRHRGDSDDPREVEDELELLVAQLRHVVVSIHDPAARYVQLVRLSMAIAATAVRYREELTCPPTSR